MAENNRNNIDELKQLNALLEQQKTLALALNNIEQARAAQAEINANNEKIINELKSKGTALTAEEKKLLQELEREQGNINKAVKTEINYRQKAVDLTRSLGTQMKNVWKFMQDADKSIKSTNLQLGLSGTKAAAMRESFEQSVGLMSRLGGDITDISSIMQGFADETGRARALTGEMVDNITLIAKGTGLGIEQATKLGAQFEIMGVDTRATMDYVQGVVDTTERMGVNTTKVLKNISDNFKKLQTYTFQQGVKGFAEMASYAEKFKIDINSALNAADVARSLEGAIDLAAQLQIMGGEFAKTDPFQMLFLSRNDPAKFTEKIADMTKGVVTFRKMADGSFEKFISPADRDRLAAVAKSLGMSNEEMTEMALRQADIAKMRKEMGGLGLTQAQKEAIEGAAIFDSKAGKFQIEIGGQMKSISELTKTQAKAFEQEQKLLKDRASDAMTFDETFKATIQTLKSTLLPLLTTINTKLLPPLQKIVDKFVKYADQGAWGMIKAAGILMSAGVLWKGVTSGLSSALGGFVKGGIGKAVAAGGGSVVASAAGNATGAAGGGIAESVAGGAGGAAKGAGMKALGKGLGAGGAMAGAGAGIMLAAKGLSQLADSMTKLTPEQAKTLERIAITMAVTFPLAAIGIALAGAAATSTAPGLLALGAAVFMVGGAVAVAALGIGKMAEGFGTMFEKSKGAGKDMKEIGVGLMGIGAGLLMASNPIGIAGFMAVTAGLSALSILAPRIERVSAAIGKLGKLTELKGMKDDFLALSKLVANMSRIGRGDRKGIEALAKLADAMTGKPLQVEFAQGKVALVNDVTLNLDGQKFMNKVYSTQIAVQKHEDTKNGKGS